MLKIEIPFLLLPLLLLLLCFRFTLYKSAISELEWSGAGNAHNIQWLNMLMISKCRECAVCTVHSAFEAHRSFWLSCNDIAPLHIDAQLMMDRQLNLYLILVVQWCCVCFFIIFILLSHRLHAFYGFYCSDKYLRLRKRLIGPVAYRLSFCGFLRDPWVFDCVCECTRHEQSQSIVQLYASKMYFGFWC